MTDKEKDYYFHGGMVVGSLLTLIVFILPVCIIWLALRHS